MAISTRGQFDRAGSVSVCICIACTGGLALIASLSGLLEAVRPGSVVVNMHGIGFLVRVPQSFNPEVDAEVKLYTSLQVREDSVSLYGFASVLECTVFEQLITISGVGPRVALAILSVLTPAEVAAAVLEGDDKPLQRVSGVGKKLAGTIVLQLAGKLTSVPLENRKQEQAVDRSAEIVQALIGLGWQRQESAAAVESVLEKDQSLTMPEILRNALRYLAKQE